jgi:hypothetical protein
MRDGVYCIRKRKSASLQEIHSKNKTKNPPEEAGLGAEGEIRTLDQGLMSPLLYH